MLTSIRTIWESITKSISVWLMNHFIFRNSDPLVKQSRAYIQMIDMLDLTTINTGLNSPNENIYSPNGDIKSDVEDLAKFISHIKNFKNQNLSSAFLSTNSKSINICNYYTTEEKKLIDIKLYTKKLTQYSLELIKIYEELLSSKNPTDVYKLNIVKKMLSELLPLLKSLSSMK